MLYNTGLIIPDMGRKVKEKLAITYYCATSYVGIEIARNFYARPSVLRRIFLGKMGKISLGKPADFRNGEVLRETHR